MERRGWCGVENAWCYSRVIDVMGIRLCHGRTMHAKLNNAPDLRLFHAIYFIFCTSAGATTVFDVGYSSSSSSLFSVSFFFFSALFCI